MIVKLTGILSEVREQAVVIDRDGIGYEVLIPGYAVGELAASRGRQVVLHTLEFLEGNAANGNMVPRLVGFPSVEDRAFFSRFIEVKGIGPKKALKALAESVARVAAWIRDGEISLLAKLPGIGRRGAEIIVAELRGKIDSFALESSGGGAARVAEWTQAQRDALEVMLRWGDNRNDALRWLDRAAQLHPEISTANEWVTACYRIRAGTEG